jgi:hypothetical protein
VYEHKKAIAQSRGKRELYEKYVRRERNREKRLYKQALSRVENAIPKH